jgi:hypothetical protein
MYVFINVQLAFNQITLLTIKKNSQMKQILFIALFCSYSAISAQKPAMINEEFYQKMMDLNLAWSEFDMPTKINGKEARFTAYQCKYFSESSPAKPCDCTKGRINLEASNGNYVPYIEFPEFPSVGILKLGIQPNGKSNNCGLAIQKLENETWVTVDLYVFDNSTKGRCIFWEPKNVSSETPIKFRLIANKSESVFLTDVYAEAY